MKIISLSFLIVVFIATSSHAVDKKYLKLLRFELVGTNLKLPNRIDEVTTMVEMRILTLHGKHYVAALYEIDTDIVTLGNSAENYRRRSIITGCADPRTMEYMKNGMGIAILLNNRSGDRIDAFKYSIKDCK